MRFDVDALNNRWRMPAKGKALGWLCTFCLLGLMAGKISAAPASEDSVEQAIALRKSGDVWASIDMLERLKKADSNNVRVYLQLVMGYLKSKCFAQADEQLSALYVHFPKMMENPKLKKLDAMIHKARQTRQNDFALMHAESEMSLKDNQTHKFDFEVTAYKGFEELTSQFSYLEITEFEDYFQVERKNDELTNKFYYTAGRLKGEYRYTPSDTFELFDNKTYWFVSNRLTHFYKKANTLSDVHFGYTSLDSSLFVMQPDHWSFNAKLQSKWHNYDGQKSLTELKTDISLSTLWHGARIKAGITHNEHTLDKQYIQDYFDPDFMIFERKTRVVTPYLKLSYRFSDDFLWSVGIHQRNIHASNHLLEGRVVNYRSTVKYDVSEDFELHLSYQHNDLRYDYYNVDACFDIESFDCFNSGELKRTFTLGSGYSINEHWQIGVNAMYMDKKQDNDFGQDQWKRLEAFVKYRF